MNDSSAAGTVSSVPKSALRDESNVTVANPFRAWLYCTISLTMTVAAMFVFANTRADLFGLRGGDDIRIHTLPRFSLYLMTYRFIPNNFDGLLIGNSLASSYDTSVIGSYKVFNAAMRASSMTEERALTEETLKRGHLKVVIIILNPTLTSTHFTRSVYMTPHDYWASFGSIQTLMTDCQVLREAIGRPGPITYDTYGRTKWPLKMLPPPVIPFSDHDFYRDPTEMNDLYSLLGELHAKGVKVYAMFSPIYQPRWDQREKQLLDWQTKVLSGFSPTDVVIRMPQNIEKTLQENRENFPDYEHLSSSASATAMGVIDKTIEQ
jgi:hypothetical protein